MSERHSREVHQWYFRFLLPALVAAAVTLVPKGSLSSAGFGRLYNCTSIFINTCSFSLFMYMVSFLSSCITFKNSHEKCDDVINNDHKAGTQAAVVWVQT